MFVSGEGAAHERRLVHEFTKLAHQPRMNDIHVRDTTSWQKQFPEFNFHRMEDLESRNILVCNASIKIMTFPRPSGAELSITFELVSPPDLADYDDLECSTRFFEDKKLVGQDENTKQTGKMAEIHKSANGSLRIRFGAGFFGAGYWACQLQRWGTKLRRASEEEQHMRMREEAAVRGELQQLTAAQDIYGVKNGKSKCLLTILWRFEQTKNRHDVGRVICRAVHFERPKENLRAKDEDLEKVLEPLLSSPRSESTTPTATSTALMYPPLSLDFGQTFPQHPTALNIDQFTLDSMASEFSQSASATASGMGHDFSQLQNFSSLMEPRSMPNSQSQGLEDANAFNFNGGHISITGCLEATGNLGPYETFGTKPYSQDFHDISPIGSFEHAAHSMPNDTSFDDLGLGMPMGTAPTYFAAPKPSCQYHPSLIADLGNAAEQYSDLMAQATTSGGQMDIDSVLDQGVPVNDDGLGSGSGGLWKLQSAFREDTGIGAVMAEGVSGQEARKDSLVEKRDSEVLKIIELLGSEGGAERYRGY